MKEREPISKEFRIKKINYLLGVEGRNGNYTEAYLRGMDEGSTMKEKQKRNVFLRNRLNRLNKYILGTLEGESDEIQEKLMEIHSVIEGMKPKGKNESRK